MNTFSLSHTALLSSISSQHMQQAAVFVLIPLLGASIVYILHATGVICLDSIFNSEDSGNLKLPLFLTSLWHRSAVKSKSPKSALSPRGLARPKSPKSETLASVRRPVSPPSRRSQPVSKATSNSLHNVSSRPADVHDNARRAPSMAKSDAPSRSDKTAKVNSEILYSDVKRKDDSFVAAPVEESAAVASHRKSGAKSPDSQPKQYVEVRAKVGDKKSKISSSSARSETVAAVSRSSTSSEEKVSQASTKSSQEMNLRPDYPTWEKFSNSKEPEISAMAAQLCLDSIPLSWSSRSSSACSTPIGTPMAGTPSVSPRSKATVPNKMHQPSRSVFAADPLNVFNLASSQDHMSTLAQTSWATVPGLDFVPPPVPSAVRSAFESRAPMAPIGSQSPRHASAHRHQLTSPTDLITKNLVDLLQPHSSSALTYPSSFGRTQPNTPLSSSIPQSNPWSRQEKTSPKISHVQRPASPACGLIWEPLANPSSSWLSSQQNSYLESLWQESHSQAWVRPQNNSRQTSTAAFWNESPCSGAHLSRQGTGRSLWGSDAEMSDGCLSDCNMSTSSRRSFFAAAY